MRIRTDAHALPPPRRAIRAATTVLSAVLLALVAAAPAASQSAAPLAYDVLPVGPGGAPVFVGTAEPGATVELLDGAMVIATGVANDRGEWILAAPGPAANPATLIVRATSAGGRFQTFSTPPPPNEAVPRAEALMAATLADGHVDGNAPVGALVRLEGAGPLAIEAVADGEGRWSVPLPELPAGAYRLSITTGADGPAPIALDLVIPLDPTALVVQVAIAPAAVANAAGTLAGPRFIVVGPRDTLWDIAVRAYGDGTRYGEIFAANRDQLRNPRRIFAGQVLLIP